MQLLTDEDMHEIARDIVLRIFGMIGYDVFSEAKRTELIRSAHTIAFDILKEELRLISDDNNP